MQQRETQMLRFYHVSRAGLLLFVCTSCTNRNEQPASATCESMLKNPDAAILANDAVRSATRKRELSDARVSRVALGDSGRGLIAVSWEAPPGSVLFLTDCKRGAFGFAGSPRVDSLSIVHMPKPDSSLVLVSYSEGGATAFEGRGVSLYLPSDSLTELWTGTTFEGDYGNKSGKVDSASVSIDSTAIIRRSWSWKIQNSGGKWIRVGPPRPQTEHYVWVSSHKRFEKTSQ
jgi:hypothetical protein